MTNIADRLGRFFPPRQDRRHARNRNSHALALVCAIGLATVAGCEHNDPVAAIIKQQESGRFAATIEPLRQLLTENRDDPHINYLYGRALSAVGNASLAEWSLRKAAADPKWLVPAATQLAVDALRTANYDTTIEMTGRILEADPDNASVRLLRARAFAASRKHKEEALAEANHVLELDPDNSEAYQPKIMALLELERIDEAVEALDQLGQSIEASGVAGPIRGWYCATKAIFANDRGESEEAAKLWEKCLKEFPGHPNVVGSALDFFAGIGDYARTLEILRAAHEAEPASLDYQRRLATLLRFAGHKDEAEALLLESAREAEPRYAPAAWAYLGKFYQDMGDQPKSIESVGKAVELARELGGAPAQLLFEYADSLVLAGEFDRALALADEMSVQPQQEMIRARVAQQQERPAEALLHYAKAFRLWPDNPWARYYAAIAFEDTGDFDRAIEAYRYSIRINAAVTDARTRLGELLSAQGQPAEALMILRHHAADMPLDVDGKLLSIRLLARIGDREGGLRQRLEAFRQLGSAEYGRALASAAEGIRRRSGPAAAVAFLKRKGATEPSHQDPKNPVALRALLHLAAEAGELAPLEALLRAHLKAQPELAGNYEMLGLWLELSHAPADATRRAYERTLELDPHNAGALAGLARSLREHEPARALELFDRAAEADPYDGSSRLAAAALQLSLGRTSEAAKRLRDLVETRPYEAAAASELVELQISQHRVDEKTELLARRATRFGARPQDFDRLARVYRERNQPERAQEAESRAQALREKSRPTAVPASH